MVTDEETEVKNTLWDGEALAESSILPDWVNGMALLRNHFFKACAIRTNIQLFFKDWCEKNNVDYETYEVKDMFGISHRLKDIKMITTDNAIKWKKFMNLMGNTPAEAYQYWCDRVEADSCYWGIVKTDHPSKLGSGQQMSYQMINTLPFMTNDIARRRSKVSTPDQYEAYPTRSANVDQNVGTWQWGVDGGEDTPGKINGYYYPQTAGVLIMFSISCEG